MNLKKVADIMTSGELEMISNLTLQNSPLEANNHDKSTTVLRPASYRVIQRKGLCRNTEVPVYVEAGTARQKEHHSEGPVTGLTALPHYLNEQAAKTFKSEK